MAWNPEEKDLKTRALGKERYKFKKWLRSLKQRLGENPRKIESHEHRVKENTNNTLHLDISTESHTYISRNIYLTKKWPIEK